VRSSECRAVGPCSLCGRSEAPAQSECIVEDAVACRPDALVGGIEVGDHGQLPKAGVVARCVRRVRGFADGEWIVYRGDIAGSTSDIERTDRGVSSSRQGCWIEDLASDALGGSRVMGTGDYQCRPSRRQRYLLDERASTFCSISASDCIKSISLLFVSRRLGCRTTSPMVYRVGTMAPVCHEDPVAAAGILV
jgi:hypothetical protein